jgi:hypothetical protein
LLRYRILELCITQPPHTSSSVALNN